MVETTKEPLDGAPAPAAKSARGQKLWAVLLVLDSFFVIIFGGALAAKLYQHWQAPPAPMRRTPKPVNKPADKPAEPAKAEAPKPEPAKAPEPPKAEPSKQTAKAEPAPKSDSPRPPKPSMLHEAPRREGAKLAGPGASAPAAAPAASGVVKAQPVEFHYKGSAKKVELVGAFIVRGGKKAMVETAPGDWTLTLYLTPNTYRYHYFVNGVKKLDPSNDKQDRGMSILTVVPPAQ